MKGLLYFPWFSRAGEAPLRPALYTEACGLRPSKRKTRRKARWLLPGRWLVSLDAEPHRWKGFVAGQESPCLWGQENPWGERDYSMLLAWDACDSRAGLEEFARPVGRRQSHSDELDMIFPTGPRPQMISNSYPGLLRIFLFSSTAVFWALHCASPDNGKIFFLKGLIINGLGFVSHTV